MVRKLLVDGQNFDAFDVEFHLEGPQEKLRQSVMYEESRWDMITRHAKRNGIFWFYRQERGENGLLDVLVFADNPRAYVRSIDVPLLESSGLRSDAHEAAQEVHEKRMLAHARRSAGGTRELSPLLRSRDQSVRGRFAAAASGGLA
jgi:type VI secretion system secreted protein VgrG